MATTKLNREPQPLHGRVAQLENAVTELQKALSSVELTPGKDGRDGRNGESIVGPKGDRGDQGPAGQSIQGRDGADGAPGAKGEKGDKGDRGEKGDPGDVTYVGPAEVEAAVQLVKAELIAQRARFVAAVTVALEKNKQRAHHPTIARTVDAVMRKLKGDAGL